jgi:hypothetical protein
MGLLTIDIYNGGERTRCAWHPLDETSYIHVYASTPARAFWTSLNAFSALKLSLLPGLVMTTGGSSSLLEDTLLRSAEDSE